MTNGRMVCTILAMTFFAVLGTAQTAKPPVKPPAPAQKPGSQPLKAGDERTYLGIITDGQCAAKGSHTEVMKKASVNSAANCVKGCARRYGYVLYNPASRKIYKLSDQELPRDYPNQRVKVKGRLDKATQTIYVSSIERMK
jgi:hypothetical protein